MSNSNIRATYNNFKVSSDLDRNIIAKLTSQIGFHCEQRAIDSVVTACNMIEHCCPDAKGVAVIYDEDTGKLLHSFKFGRFQD